MIAKAKQPKTSAKVGKDELAIKSEPDKIEARSRADVALNRAANGMATIPGCEGQSPMPHARRQGQRSADRQP